MSIDGRRAPSLLHALIVTMLACACVLMPLAATAAASSVGAAASPAQLSIAIDNGRTAVRVGDKLTYRITVQNLGQHRIAGLRVTQSLPPGLIFGSADSRGVSKAGQVSWRLDLKAGAKATVETTTTVSKTPDTLLRLASVACASISAKGSPNVCAADSDQLPAGASAAAKTAAKAGGGSISAGSLALWLGLGLVLVLGAGAVVFARRTSPAPARKNKRDR